MCELPERKEMYSDLPCATARDAQRPKLVSLFANMNPARWHGCAIVFRQVILMKLKQTKGGCCCDDEIACENKSRADLRVLFVRAVCSRAASGVPRRISFRFMRRAGGAAVTAHERRKTNKQVKNRSVILNTSEKRYFRNLHAREEKTDRVQQVLPMMRGTAS